jgi:hypothetical protein
VAYPLFQPPFAFFAARHHREWTKDEAVQFRDWLLSNINPITDAFIARLGLTLDVDSEALLAAAGTKVSALLRTREFSRAVLRLQVVPNSQGRGEASLQRRPGPELTPEGHAIAIHIGLLTARLLMRDHRDTLRWKIVTTPKNDLSFHLTVVAAPGRDPIVYEPVIRAHATAITALERRFPDEEVWVHPYRYLASRAV